VSRCHFLRFNQKPLNVRCACKNTIKIKGNSSFCESAHRIIATQQGFGGGQLRTSGFHKRQRITWQAGPL